MRKLMQLTLGVAIVAAMPSALAGSRQMPFNGRVSAAQAAPGDLDLTFSGDGRQITDFGNSDYGQSVAIQPDGKVVVVGRTYGGPSGAQDFALARYSSDGSLDTSFSDDGKQTTAFPEASIAFGVVLQPDGKIVVVGVGGGVSSYDFAVARYNPDGSLDATFADDGRQTTDFAGYTDAAYGVSLQSDGRIVVVGIGGDDFALARYNVDGTLDTSFSEDGKQTTHLGPSGYDSDYARAVAIQADGKIVVAGSTDAFPPCDVSIDSCDDPPSDFALARYNADGTLDNSFSGDGILTADFGGTGDAASGVALQPDGKIVVAGSSDVASSTILAVARFWADGSLDETFGGGGMLTTQFVAGGAASVFAFQPDGKIVALGNAGGDFALARYNSDGSLDATFSGTGTQTTDFGGSDFGGGVALQPDGKIVAVGGTWGATGVNFALARYHGMGGSPDTIPPDTAITGGPTGTTSDSTPTFSFASSEDGSTFACRVDDTTAFPCSSPHTSTVDDGPHTFEAWATDAAGNPDPSPASRGFSVDTAPPETTVTGGPTGTTNESTPTFGFDSSEGGSTFTCRVDDTAFLPCSSPHTTSTLSEGPHSFEVRATDGAGNTDPTPASRNLMVVTNYRAEVLVTSGLVSYWHLDETSGTTAADATGANNGNYRNGVLLGRPGALLCDPNASASFDGSNDYVSVAGSVSLDTGDSFTLEAWVKRSRTSASIETVLSNGKGSGQLSFVNNVLTLTKGNNSGTIARAKAPTIDTTVFHHLVATKSGGVVKLYIDGIDQTGAVTNRTIVHTSTALNIGRDTAGSEYFAGLIDEVAMYNVALDAAQVQRHFKASGR